MRRLSCLAFVAVALAVPSSAAADELIADEQRPTPISAHDGRVAWSSYDGATERFELMTQAAGVISRVPVAAKAQAFDVDLGDNGRGDTVAAYSRCSREFALPLGQAQRRPPEGCDVFMFNFATGQERKIDGASTRNASEYLPTVAGGRVAFARVYERRRGARGQLPYLYVRPLADNVRSRRLPGGARGRTGRPGPTSLDLGEDHLAFAWGRRLSHGRYRSAIRLDRLTTSADAPGADDNRVLRTATRASRPGGLISPSLAGSTVLFAQWSLPTSHNNRLYLTGTDRGGTRFAATPALLTAIAQTVDGNGYFYARASSLTDAGQQRCPCQIGRIDAITFEGASSR